MTAPSPAYRDVAFGERTKWFPGQSLTWPSSSLSAYNAPSFRAGAQLLSSLSGYAYTKRAWKKELLELFLDPTFFQMDTSCVQ